MSGEEPLGEPLGEPEGPTPLVCRDCRNRTRTKPFTMRDGYTYRLCPTCLHHAWATVAETEVR